MVALVWLREFRARRREPPLETFCPNEWGWAIVTRWRGRVVCSACGADVDGSRSHIEIREVPGLVAR